MYYWLIATKRADADTVVNALMQRNATFGTSTTWISGQASHFKRELIDNLRTALMVQYPFTPEYGPRANGTVEALCKQVLRSGRALLADFGLQLDQWPEVLPLIQSVLNNSPRQDCRNAPRCKCTADARRRILWPWRSPRQRLLHRSTPS
jgi:hypothetical protein